MPALHVKISEYILLALLFIIPLQTRWIFEEGILAGGPWEYGTISVYVTEILIFAFLLYQARVSCVQTETPRPSYGIYWTLIVLLCFSFISMNWADSMGVAVIAGLHLFFAGVTLFLVGKSGLPRSRLAAAFVSGIALQAALGVAQIAVQYVSPSTLLGIAAQDPGELGVSVVLTEAGRFLRAYGGMPHPNILGGYLAVGLIFLLPLLIHERISWKRGLLWAGTVLFVVALFLTFSRSAWLGAILGILFSLVFVFTRLESRDKKDSAVFLGIVLAVVLILGLAFGDTVFGRLKGGNYLETTSVNERIQGAHQAWSLIQERPWHGFGIGNYTNALAKKFPGQSSWAYQPVHNVFLLSFAELGVIGLVLGFVMAGIVFAASVIKRCKALNLWFIASFGALLGLAIISFFDHYLWSLYPGLLLGAFTLGFWNREIRRN